MKIKIGNEIGSNNSIDNRINGSDPSMMINAGINSTNGIIGASNNRIGSPANANSTAAISLNALSRSLLINLAQLPASRLIKMFQIVPKIESGNNTNNANNPSGIVNKFKPGINAVSKPIKIIGTITNNLANVKNGNPPKNNLSNPTMRPLSNEGINASNALFNKIKGNSNAFNSNISIAVNTAPRITASTAKNSFVKINATTALKSANGIANNPFRIGSPIRIPILSNPTRMFLRILKIIAVLSSLLKKLSPGRIVHRGDVRRVAPNVNNSAINSRPLLIKLNNVKAICVNSAANNGSPNNNNGLNNNAFNAKFNKNNGNASNNCNGNHRSKSNKSLAKLRANCVRIVPKTVHTSCLSKLFRIPNVTSGNPANNAKSPSGTVNKFNPGIKAVNNPLRINGSNNPSANSKNGSPPNNALSSPTNNPANTAGIKLVNKFLTRINGIASNPNNSFAKNVPIAERIPKFNHLSGFKNVITPSNGNNSKNVNPATNAGIRKSLNKSPRILIGNNNSFNPFRSKLAKPMRFIATMIKSKNGIKFGNDNKINAINGKLSPNRPNANRFNRPNAPSNNASGKPRANNKPIPLINNGNTTKLLNALSSKAGIPTRLNNVNVLNNTNGNVNNVITMSEMIPAPIANNTDVNGLMNNQYGIDNNNPPSVKKLIKPANNLSGSRIKKLIPANPALNKCNKNRIGPTTGTNNEIGANNKFVTAATTEIAFATPSTKLVNPIMN